MQNFFMFVILLLEFVLAIYAKTDMKKAEYAKI